MLTYPSKVEEKGLLLETQYSKPKERYFRLNAYYIKMTSKLIC